MIFKKKYKHSEWMEGLLWAEHNLYKYSNTTDNLFVEDTDGMEEYNILWRNRSHEKPWWIKTVNREFGAGILDYINYFNEKLK